MYPKGQKEWFMAGYHEMLRQIEPERISKIIQSISY